jgi:hypothetical protein
MHAYDFLNQFSKCLTQLSTLLDKAQSFVDERKYDSKKLLAFSLAPDQFNLGRQVQITCDMAKFYVSRLTGKEGPKQEDTETTIPELQQRIQKTIHFLQTVSKEDFNGWEDRKTTNPRREGKYLPGRDYAMQHAIPNFYFHFTTAYSILRTCGLEIGKKDFLGEIVYLEL